MWERLQKKIQLLDELFKEVGLGIEDILKNYPESNFYLRLLGLKDQWTEQDMTDLRERIKGTRHHRNKRDERTCVGELLLGCSGCC